MMTINDSRTQILTEVRAKREAALRSARGGNVSEEEYWLGIAARMTTWIEHLEQNAGRPVRPWPMRDRLGIDLPPSARRVRTVVPVHPAE